ncbi:unnamed protein product [Cylicostephanus goldi]|uniref:Uncharacterized protein n=1 Tax=Cylicostephanus goldi TaxID=71465 RepID=A0A3P6QRS6_CYLGO|nr:unnamed protein product [Cylicostephanus goldi]
MNLYTPGKGLFGTRVTWNDIEEDMLRELHTYAFFGPNKTAENIGDGKGFMSRIVLVDPNWQFKDKDLPNRFIVKILTQLAMRTLNHELDKEEHENSYITKKFLNSFDEGQKIVSTPTLFFRQL